MKKINIASVLVVAVVLASLLLAACGPTPAPTPLPTGTPTPLSTLRPTFTPTTLAQATEEPTEAPTKAPTAKPTEAEEKPQPSDTPTRESKPTTEPTTEPTPTAAKDTPETPEETPTPPDETPTPAATRAAGPPPKLQGRLLFPMFDSDDQTYHIYALNLASGQAEIYIEEASQPAITSNGERIGWRSWKRDQRGLLSRPIDSTDIWTMIRFSEAARPDWAPGSEEFVFPSRQEPDRESRLYLYTGTDEEEPFIEIQRHGSPVIGRTPAFLPDGRIVYQGCVENACGLYLMGMDGANPQQLTEFKDDTVPAVSPGGKQIAYMSFVSGYWQIHVINADGTEQRPLTDDWYWNGLPTWSPDGKHIIFVSTRDENWPDKFVVPDNTESEFRLWVMGADGGNQRLLNEFSFRMDGIPANVPDHEVAGWIEERILWLSGSGSVD